MKTVRKSRSRPKNKKAPFTRLLHGLTLHYCSNFKAWIQPRLCEPNRAMGRKFLNTACHKLELTNTSIIETSESRVDCVRCPGVMERCRREK